MPDEFLLTGCGFLIYQGNLHFAPTLASAFAGSSCGITCSYLIGKTVGWKFLHTRAGRLLHVRDEHIYRVHSWFDRIGHWALLVGYFIPGVRHFTAIVAGTSRLEFRSFALFAYAGALLWVSTFVTLGYHFGKRWEEILAVVEHHLKLASIVAGALVIAYLLYLFFKRKSKSA